MQRKYLKKENILTIPNLLSLIRILLIPYCAQKAYLHTIIVIALSGFTDIIDGKIARKFNMVSDVGRDNLSRMGLLKNPGTTTVSGFFFCLKLCFGANMVQLSMKKYPAI